MTAAFRTGFPLSSLITTKVNHEVGASSLSFCAAAAAAMIIVMRNNRTAPRMNTFFMPAILCSRGLACHLRFNSVSISIRFRRRGRAGAGQQVRRAVDESQPSVGSFTMPE